MKITVVSGSVRDDSQSRKVSDYLAKRLKGLSAEVTLVDLNESRLPLFDDGKSGQAEWDAIKDYFENADGFIFVSPEWDGMFNVGLHNMFHYALNALGHKPVMLVGVSSGRGGAYPLAQMKMMGQKNTHFVIVPENLRVMDVEKILVDGEFTEPSVRERAEYSMTLLLEYAEALKQIRDKGIIDYKKFGSGV